MYYRKAITTLRNSNDSSNLAATLFNAGDEMLKARVDDSAFLYLTEAKIIFENLADSRYIGYFLGNLGILQGYKGNFSQADRDIKEAIRILEANEDYYPVCDYLLALADIYKEKNQITEAINYANRSLKLGQQFNLVEQIANASNKLSMLYEVKGDADQSLQYYKLYVQYRDSLNNLPGYKKMADLRTDFEVSQIQNRVNLLTRQKNDQKKLLLASSVIGAMAIIIVLIMVRNTKHKKKAYSILATQKQETDTERAKAENALTELRKTQKQLIHAEKMASMGELTAGIAHEIQNPLNFVNNFSEINKELSEEIANEVEKGNLEEIKLIAIDIKENSEKISLHGKRADAIVKGMLQHSRSSAGSKEPTDINALADEYLRLAYHGLRAKDKSFNAKLITDFDKSIGKIEVVPQDMGRVFLNLITNAFYACNQKLQSTVANDEANQNYEPEVSISTKKLNNQIEISVKDNANGIPQNVIDKVFQPFFTTKPTGEGTGLGLSLAYDIVKTHGGELNVETKKGEGTTFTVLIPAN